MLYAVPRSWFSWVFTIRDGVRPLGTIDLGWVREAGTLHLEGAAYRLRRERLGGGAFTLEREGRVLARAVKPSALVRSFVVEADGTSYTLEAEAALRRRFVLRRDGREIGSVRPEHAFTTRAIIDLPEEIALPVRIFLAWLTILLWKREAESSA